MADGVRSLQSRRPTVRAFYTLGLRVGLAAVPRVARSRAAAAPHMEQYEVGRVLGQGAQGRALLVTRKSDGAQLAMKQMGYADMSAAEQKASIQEVGLLSRLQHPNIIGYHDAFLEDGQLCIVMELASGGSLEDELAAARTSGVQLSEQRMLDLLAQLADAVHYMHACRRRRGGRWPA